jgi:perosamine synthetase
MSEKASVFAVVQALNRMFAEKKRPIPLHEPRFVGKEWDYVKECLDTGWVSSNGKYVDLFEQKLAEYTGIKHAVAVVNGTAALHICLKLAGVQPGDEVIIPALTFIATANAVTYCGAIPHFVDCEDRTLGMDPYQLKDYLRDIAEVRESGCFNKLTGQRIKAVIPMHTFGHPVDLDPLGELCQRYKLAMVEDAAESLGSYYKGRHTGNWGTAAAFSFNGNKVVTTGGGGAILTNDSSIAKQAKHLTTTAKVSHRWAFVHDQIGYNYRLPNLNAAIGCAQLEQLEQFIEQKRLLAENYQEVFCTVRGVKFFSEPEFARSNYWLNVLLLDEDDEDKRDQLLTLTHDQGILTRPAWTLLTKLEMFKMCPKMPLPMAERLERQIINLPSSAYLGVSL